jgi:predicted metal-dependent hydrolase
LIRARDRLGRPVNSDSPDAVPGIVERDEIDSATAWREATSYLERDLPFHAHEIFEMRWRCCPENERALWRALARWAAAITHIERGNPEGASSIARETMADLAQADPSPLARDDIDGVLASLLLLSQAK